MILSFHRYWPSGKLSDKNKKRKIFLYCHYVLFNLKANVRGNLGNGIVVICLKIALFDYFCYIWRVKFK